MRKAEGETLLEVHPGTSLKSPEAPQLPTGPAAQLPEYSCIRVHTHTPVSTNVASVPVNLAKGRFCKSTIAAHFCNPNTGRHGRRINGKLQPEVVPERQSTTSPLTNSLEIV